MLSWRCVRRDGAPVAGAPLMGARGPWLAGLRNGFLCPVQQCISLGWGEGGYFGVVLEAKNLTPA